MVKVFMPYSRSYVISKYPGLDVSLLKLFEQIIFPKFLQRIASIDAVDSIICASNDLENLVISEKSKLNLYVRDEQDLGQLSRNELVDYGCKISQSTNFVMINPLFPLLSINTISSIITEMSLSECNVFMGNLGLCRDLDGATVAPGLSHMAWDLGSITAYFNCQGLAPWKLYSNYSSLETLSVRNINDFNLINTLQVMGY